MNVNQNAYLWSKTQASLFRTETNAANLQFQNSIDELNKNVLNNSTGSVFNASRSDSAPMRAFLQQSPGSDATTQAPSWLEPVRERKQNKPYVPGEAMMQQSMQQVFIIITHLDLQRIMDLLLALIQFYLIQILEKLHFKYLV